MNGQSLDWLLEDKNPAIKYRTLTEICGKSQEEYQDVYDSIWEQKSIVNMMSKQDENGRLKLEGTLTKQPCSFGTVGKENKWITFYALLAEKYRML